MDFSELETDSRWLSNDRPTDLSSYEKGLVAVLVSVLLQFRWCVRSAVKELPPNTFVEWSTGTHGAVRTTLSAWNPAAKPRDGGTFVGWIRAAARDALILLTEAELEEVWRSKELPPTIVFDSKRSVPLDAGCWAVHIHARSTRQHEVALTVANEGEVTANPILPRVQPLSTTFDADAVRTEIIASATPSGLLLLHEYDADPIATWARLRATDLSSPAAFDDALTVSRELVRRVVINLRKLIVQLEKRIGFEADPLVPAINAASQVAALEEVLGARMPAVLRAFFERVDEVDLRNETTRHDERADALIINALSKESVGEWPKEELLAWMRRLGVNGSADTSQVYAMSPDATTKAGFSGGENYLVVLESNRVDPICLTPYSSTCPTFVDYLRYVIGRGGYAGLRRSPVALKPLALLPF